MIVDLILVVVVFYLSIPAVTGYCAYSYGRSFWFWFGMGFFLPIITHIILYFLISYDIKKQKTTDLLTRDEEIMMEQNIQTVVDSETNKARVKYIKKSL
ncbi:MAG: hypothetical protein AAFX87_06955 [Bacteroidota bacterium]